MRGGSADLSDDPHQDIDDTGADGPEDRLANGGGHGHARKASR